jgi:hypothetical protein
MKTKIKNFCQKWDIKEFSFFGSYNTEKFNSKSDIDVLVSFGEKSEIGFFELAQIKDELEAILGRNVDLVTRRGVESSKNHIRKNSILSSTQLFFSEN